MFILDWLNQYVCLYFYIKALTKLAFLFECLFVSRKFEVLKRLAKNSLQILTQIQELQKKSLKQENLFINKFALNALCYYLNFGKHTKT
jgi:hypothetical protein